MCQLPNWHNAPVVRQYCRYDRDMNKPILIKQFANRWYLYWADNGRTIASFATQFEAYAARKSVIEFNNNKGGIS